MPYVVQQDNARHRTTAPVLRDGHQENHAVRVFYAILIVFVVAGHIVGNQMPSLYGLMPVYAFHMPGFVFLAGYLYNERHERHPFRYLLGRVTKLLVPMYAIHLLLGLLIAHLHGQGFTYGGELSWETLLLAPWDSDNMHIFSFELAMWFIPPLFVAQCSFMLLRKVIIHGGESMRRVLDWILCILLVIGGACVTQMCADGTIISGNWITVWQSVFFLSFMALGHLYRKYIEKFANRIPDGVAIVGLIALSTVMMAIYGEKLIMVVCWMGFPAGWVGTYVGGILGVLLWYRIAKILGPRLGRDSLVRTIGMNTFSIMCWHFVGFFMLNMLFLLLRDISGGALCEGFSLEGMHKEVYYFWFPDWVRAWPGGIAIWQWLYLSAGIAFSLAVHGVYALVRSLARRCADLVMGKGDGGDGNPPANHRQAGPRMGPPRNQRRRPTAREMRGARTRSTRDPGSMRGTRRAS